MIKRLREIQVDKPFSELFLSSFFSLILGLVIPFLITDYPSLDALSSEKDSRITIAFKAAIAIIFILVAIAYSLKVIKHISINIAKGDALNDYLDNKEAEIIEKILDRRIKNKKRLT